MVYWFLPGARSLGGADSLRTKVWVIVCLRSYVFDPRIVTVEYFCCPAHRRVEQLWYFKGGVVGGRGICEEEMGKESSFYFPVVLEGEVLAATRLRFGLFGQHYLSEAYHGFATSRLVN